MRVSVIVPAFNAGDTLPRTLECLARQQIDGRYEIIVVDDGSSDETVARTAAASGDVRLIRQEHRGPAAARNLGASVARGEALAFTDADCFPDPGWLSAGLAGLAHADLIQGAVKPDPAARAGPFDRTLWVLAESGLYETANLFVRRELFDALGGFEVWLEPDLGKPLAEDLWLGWRARRSGARTGFCSEALVHHAVFRRGVPGYVAERRRLVHFPAIADQVPELRTSFFFARIFLNRRSAAFDAALLGAVLAVSQRSRWPLVVATPYAAISVRHAIRWGRRAPLVALGGLAADTVGCVALVRGSAGHRAILL